MSTAPHVVYEFGVFRVDSEREAVLRDGEALPITPKVFEVLLALVQHCDEVVTKEELLRTVWAGRVVEEANLSQCIYLLRKLLGEGHNQRRYIQTVSHHGYRFVAPVTVVQEPPEVPHVSGVAPVPTAPGAPGALALPDARSAPAAADLPGAPEAPVGLDAHRAPVVPSVPGAPGSPDATDMHAASNGPRASDVPNALDAADPGADVPEDLPETEITAPTALTAPPAPNRRPRGRRWTLAGIAVIVVAALVLGTGWFLHRSPAAAVTTTRPDPAPATAPKPFAPPADSLAVLPLLNLSGDPTQQYLSDGITEDLTDALGQNPALRVIAWATASRYRSKAPDVARIGRQLNVAHLLNGSIQRMGDELRVTVELVDTRSGRQVWSQHYDGGLGDIFKVQDQISEAIAVALRVKFASLGPPRTVNPRAYDLVQQARALIVKARTAAPIEQAMALYRRAIALDPTYADAHAYLGGAWLDLTGYSALPVKEILRKARTEVAKALALDPRNVEALLVLAGADRIEVKSEEARAGFERVLAIDPSNAVAHLNYGTLLPLKQALAQFQEAARLDPDNATAQADVATAELDLGEYDLALAPTLALVKLDPASPDSALGLAQNYALLHRNEDAVKAFDLAHPTTELGKALVAAGRLTYQSVLDPGLRANALAAVAALRQRPDLDPTSSVDVMQLELALGQKQSALEQLPKFCAAAPVGCGDLKVNPTWIPLRGDPRFEALVNRYGTVSK